jgi:regulator of protease activity HflC (stomatin/prohibitin superfamily)
MTDDHNDEQTAASSAAMNRVLEAEHAAEEAVAECERHAQALLQAGYARAQRITARADERISLLRMRCIERVTRQIEVMERAERAEQQDFFPELTQAARLDSIVEELVVALSGGDSMGPGGQKNP